MHAARGGREPQRHDQPHPDCAKGKSKDTITFGVSSKIFLNGELPTIQNKLTIEGGNVATIDGSGADRIMETAAATILTLRNVTLAHGAASSDGGGVLNLGALTLDHTTFSHNAAGGGSRGGGVYSEGSSVTVLDRRPSGRPAILAASPRRPSRRRRASPARARS